MRQEKLDFKQLGYLNIERLLKLRTPAIGSKQLAPFNSNERTRFEGCQFKNYRIDSFCVAIYVKQNTAVEYNR